MRRYKEIIAVAALICGMQQQLMAQKDSLTQVKRIIDITAALSVQDAVKIGVEPVQESLSIPKAEISYVAPPILFVSVPYKTRLSAPGLGSPKNPALNHNFAKIGIGNYTDVYAEFFYNTLRSRTSSLAVQGLHHSGNGPEKYSGFSDNLLGLYGKQVMGKFIGEGDLGFETHGLHYYGKTTDSITDNTIRDNQRQRFTDFHLAANVGNTLSDSGKFHFNTGIAYYNFSDLLKNSENDVTVLASAIEPFNANRILFNASYDYMTYKTAGDYTRNLLKIDVAYKFTWNGLRGKVGFKTATETDSSSSPFHPYPDIRLEYDLADKFLTAFGGITGDLQKNTYKSLSLENPFIKPGAIVRNTNNSLDLFAGLRASPSNSTSLLITGAYRNYTNMYFFVNDIKQPKLFIPLYDSGTTTVANLHMEGSVDITEDFRLGAAFELNKYTVTEKIKSPFHKPGLEASLNGRYNIQNKVIISTDLFLIGSRTARNPEDISVITLKPIFDANLNFTYSFSNIKGLKAYIDLKNIAGSKYTYWNYYPYRGFQVVGGLMMNFL